LSVIVDTTVWSLVLRRRPAQLSQGERAFTATFRGLLRQRQVVLLGLVRQEVLSGIPDEVTFARVRNRLRWFEDAPVVAADHETAGEFYNHARARGVQGSHIDFLISAIALRYDRSVFTTDRDFSRYAAIMPIPLHDRPR
jgi:predicted nucleic acid-binding protein